MATRSKPRVRLLPVTLFAAALLLTVKLGEVWSGLANLAEPSISVTGAFAKAADEDEAAAAGASGGEGDTAGAEPEGVGDGAGGDASGALGLSAAEVEVLQQLAERRNELDTMAQEAAQRDALLRAAENRIEEKIDALRALKAELESLIQVHDDQREAQINSLVKIYENMKPKDAARIFEELDMDTLLLVADRMKERKLAPVMAQMNPRKAKDITVELARLRELTEFSAPGEVREDG